MMVNDSERGPRYIVEDPDGVEQFMSSDYQAAVDFARPRRFNVIRYNYYGYAAMYEHEAS